MQLNMIHVISNFQLYRLALYVVLWISPTTNPASKHKTN